MYAYAVGLADALWLCPECAFRLFFASVSDGVRASVGRLLFAPCSCWRILSWWSSLWLRVFGSYWISPLFFPDCRYTSKATCTALPPVRRLSFVLGNISFWLGFGLCLKILFAPCGCRRAYCGPHCGHKSARVLASLIGSSSSGV